MRYVVADSLVAYSAVDEARFLFCDHTFEISIRGHLNTQRFPQSTHNESAGIIGKIARVVKGSRV